MKCSRCGNEVGGAGQYVLKYGFLCYSCSASLDMMTCVVCGQRFSRGDMVEFQGELFCKDDYKGRMAQIESYKPKPQPKGPLIRGGAGLRTPRRRAGKEAKAPYESMAGEIRAMTKPMQTEAEAKGAGATGAAPGEQEKSEISLSPEAEKAAISEILKGIREMPVSKHKEEESAVSETLDALRGPKKIKKEDKKD